MKLKINPKNCPPKNGGGNAKLMINASLVLSVLCGFSSCKDEIESEIVEDNAKMQSLDVSDGTLRLGKKIPNPYSLKVVQQAYNELAEQSGLRSCETIAPTHLYLKFAPKNLEELRLLESDTTLYFYNYPLDVELIGEGGGYHDPSLPDSVPTYQYVCVPIDHPLPEVEYEVLDEIYYEEDDEAELRSGRAISWEQLEEKAYLLVGDSSIISTPETRGSKWRAGGRLRYEDNYTNTVVPLEGVPVRMRYHIITYQNCTDKSGYFQCSTTKRGDCKYSIEWKRAVFRIIPEDKWFVTADYVIQENKSRVDKIFRKSENVKQWIYASLFIPAHEFFYKDMCGIQRPEEDIDITPKTKDDDLSSGSHQGARPKEIRIFRYYGKTQLLEKNSASYYGTTIHELAHSCHREYVGNSTFRHTYDSVKDTWAVGVQDYCSLRKYGEYGRLITYSNSTKPYNSQYTGLINDLRDDAREDPKFIQDCPSDKVKGFSLLDVQKALKDAESWNEFKNNFIKANAKNNETEKNIRTLFDYWENIK